VLFRSQAIEEADREGQPSSVSTGVQGMTKEQESDIRKKIRAGMLVMAKEKGVLLMAKAKVAAYNEALAFVRSQTGYEDLQDVIDLFNQYEQEKYEKLGAISRLVRGQRRRAPARPLGGCGGPPPLPPSLLPHPPAHTHTHTHLQLVEIERNEVELQGSRSDVQTKEESTSVLKQQRAKQMAFLEEQARTSEERASESLANANRVSTEVKTVLVAMEMLFYTLAAGQALTVPSQMALSSPSAAKSRPTASLKMYSSPALVQAVHEGSSITMSSLPSFMGMMENRASDLIQTYAAKVTMGEVQEDGEALDAEEAAEAAEAAEDKLLAAGAESAEAVAEGGDAKVAELMASMEGEASKGDAEAGAGKRFFSPAALGPSRPTGKLKESLTTSALVAAMSISAGIGGDEGAGAGKRGGGAAGGGSSARGGGAGRLGGGREEAEEEEEAGGKPGVALRPLSLEEIKRQAVGNIHADRTVRAIGSAAAMAALVLGRGGM
jgi:hypothetical protein